MKKKSKYLYKKDTSSVGGATSVPSNKQQRTRPGFILKQSRNPGEKYATTQDPSNNTPTNTAEASSMQEPSSTQPVNQPRSVARQGAPDRPSFPVKVSDIQLTVPEEIPKSFSNPLYNKNEGDNQTGDSQTQSTTSPEQSTTPQGSSTGDQSSIIDKIREDPVSTAFSFIYLLAGSIAALTIVVLFILGTIDLLKFKIKQIQQYVSLLIYPNMFNKDTLDFAVLLYKQNDKNKEPFTLYLQQEIIGGMFGLATGVVAAIGIQVMIFLVLVIVYRVIKKDKDFDIGKIELGKNTRAFISVGLMLVLAFVGNAVYNSRFINKVQTNIIYTYNNIEEIKNYIYDNLTTNEAFLSALVRNDLDGYVKIINQQTNDNRIARMIYTLSLYNFFKINVSDNNETYDAVIKKIFNISEIRLRTINPLEYMYYNQNVFIPNMYNVIRPYIEGSNKAITSSTREKIIRKDILQRINETNKRLMALYRVPTRRNEVNLHLYINWGIYTLFLLIIYALYKEPLGKLIGGDIIDIIKNGFSKLVNVMLPFLRFFSSKQPTK